MIINIKEHAKKWRENKLSKPCEFCRTKPEKVSGAFGIIDRLVYGDRCWLCCELIKNQQEEYNTDEEIIKRVGKIK